MYSSERQSGSRGDKVATKCYFMTDDEELGDPVGLAAAEGECSETQVGRRGGPGPGPGQGPVLVLGWMDASLGVHR